jgi:hypothetical protein
MPKMFKNPVTGEKKTAVEWAIKLEHSGSPAFRSYYIKWTKKGQPEIAFYSKQERTALGRKNQYERGGDVFLNEQTGESKTAVEWAKILEITTSGFWGRIRKYGKNSPMVFMSPQESKKLKIQAMRDGSALRGKFKGPRVQIEDIKVGSWERENLL